MEDLCVQGGDAAVETLPRDHAATHPRYEEIVALQDLRPDGENRKPESAP